LIIIGVTEAFYVNIDNCEIEMHTQFV
jgi:hypothetical protein